MRLPPLPLIRDAHFCVSGHVTIHPSAVIAPSVMLQADPGSHLIIAEGVCIGVGSILHAHQGILEIEAGVTLGRGVLIIGSGKIGANACIGSASTIFNGSVLSGQSIPPGSLIGDGSRQVAIGSSSEAQMASEPAPTQAPPPIGGGAASPAPPASSSSEPTSEQDSVSQPGSSQETQSEPPTSPTASSSSPKSAHSSPSKMIYGQAYLERMMITMFPYRQALDSPEPTQE